MAVGYAVVGIMMGVFAIDLPWYFVAQNQLQTAVDAAVLAGAAELPNGQEAAEAAAMDMVAENVVAGQPINPADLHFTYSEGEAMTMEVSASAPVPTFIAKLLCATQTLEQEEYQGEEGGDGGGSIQNCDIMTVHAGAKATPAARDTILVIDTSNSMDDLGNGQPFKDVKKAATQYVTAIKALNTTSVDRIGLVTFDANTALKKGLTTDYTTIKTQISGLTLYSGSGWNTNYYLGLKTAMDELEAHGRENSSKTIIFLTDGYANLPGNQSINTCVNYYNNKKKSQAKTCAQTYTNYLVSMTQGQANRAAADEVTIYTIQIGGDDSNSLNTIRTLLQNNSWDPGLLDYMANLTDGNQYEATTSNTTVLSDFYSDIAQDVHLKLSG